MCPDGATRAPAQRQLDRQLFSLRSRRQVCATTAAPEGGATQQSQQQHRQQQLKLKLNLNLNLNLNSEAPSVATRALSPAASSSRLVAPLNEFRRPTRIISGAPTRKETRGGRKELARAQTGGSRSRMRLGMRMRSSRVARRAKSSSTCAL